MPINPNYRSRKYMFIDDQGFFSFKLCRSSDIKEKKIYNKGDHADDSEQTPPSITQSIIMQVFTIYNEKIGRIQVQEFFLKVFEGKIEVK